MNRRGGYRNNGWNRSFGGGATISNMTVNFNFDRGKEREAMSGMFGPLGEPAQHSKIGHRGTHEYIDFLESDDRETHQEEQKLLPIQAEEVQFEVVDEPKHSRDEKVLCDFGRLYITDETYELRIDKDFDIVPVKGVENIHFNDKIDPKSSFLCRESDNLFIVDSRKLGTEYSNYAFTKFVEKILTDKGKYFYIILLEAGGDSEEDEPESMFNDHKKSIWLKKYLKIDIQ